ncbi:MAG: 3-dehydroquinate synthase [Syntrophales bacterium]|nr:3-dehydroquinate synthase [Syntrophales bacterium]
MKQISVDLRKRVNKSYDIYIGHHILDRMPPLLARHKWGDRYVVITDETVYELHGKEFVSHLSKAGIPVEILSFPAGEKSKNINILIGLAEKLIGLGCDRGSCLIALGGGVVGDMAGFLASIFMRGIAYLQVPTTLLAQVDSSIGGKTGVDIKEGKNLIGTFHQPRAVFIDTFFLSTLPDEEFKNGLAEIVKYGLIESRGLFQFLEEKREEILSRKAEVLDYAIGESCRIKKNIVELDECEAGIRKVLNFGHTIGHAIERASNYRYPHGHAVSIGILAESRLSEAMGYLDTQVCHRIEQLLADFDLPRRLPPGLTYESILTGIQTDKKKAKGQINFVLLKDIGLPFLRAQVEDELIKNILETLIT